ncbi:MAG: hypothetical protein CMN97_00460 [Synechococcus sp. NAT40]|nr:hypothetical protein [Synechococcus sp. NAT40]
MVQPLLHVMSCILRSSMQMALGFASRNVNVMRQRVERSTLNSSLKAVNPVSRCSNAHSLSLKLLQVVGG